MKHFLFAALLAAAARAADFETCDIEPVWSAHPVGFGLLTHGQTQFVAYYDAQRRMSVAQRSLDSTNWTITKLDSTLGWDSHNYIAMTLDRENFLHVSGNMHCVPLVYFRSDKPLDASSLKRATMTGDREKSVTYPIFLSDKAGRLIFRYRDGHSGSGDDLYNVYDEKSHAWSRLLDTPLMSGQGKMNAYAITPKRGPDGRFHILWVWRDTPDCSSNHDLSYAMSDDLVSWTDSFGRKLALPITLKTGEIIDPVPVHGGLLNVNRKLGFDNAGRPVATYQKYDANGDLQIYAARRNATGWQIVRVSWWEGYRWDFNGGGTIVCEVDVGEAKPIGDGKLTVTYRYPHGSGTWVLDEKTLLPIAGAKPPPAPDRIPRAALQIESTFPGMKKKIAGDDGTAPGPERYVLTWETLEANRDHPREGDLPAPSMLRVVKFATR